MARLLLQSAIKSGCNARFRPTRGDAPVDGQVWRGRRNFQFPARTGTRAIILFSEDIVESAYSFFTDNSTFHYKKPQDLEGYTVALYGISSGTGIALQDLHST